MEDNEATQKGGMPKLFEIYRRQRQDSETSMSDCPEIDFTYADSDSYENEIAELYSYSEGPEFQLNIKAFESVCSEAKVLALWQSMTEEKRFSLLTRVTDQMELCDSAARATASRAVLYIVQVCHCVFLRHWSGTGVFSARRQDTGADSD
ncbi:N1221-like [Trinorchestia longiramus]|nr:N1221-like [Trinorchestia longiramus]